MVFANDRNLQPRMDYIVAKLVQFFTARKQRLDLPQTRLRKLRISLRRFEQLKLLTERFGPELGLQGDKQAHNGFLQRRERINGFVSFAMKRIRTGLRWRGSRHATGFATNVSKPSKHQASVTIRYF